ncbi:MAG: nucleotidyltransferase family protein [Bacteroidota bacterium]
MQTKEEIFSIITNFLKEKGAKEISIFGSYARNEETPDSDIDILMEIDPGKSLLEHIAMEQELSEILNIKVDLLTTRGVSPLILDEIMKDRKIIYS